MKLKKIKINQNIVTYLKYIYLLTVISIIIIALFILQFLYKNFYQTISQSQEIIILRQEVAPEAINNEKVNAVLSALNKKISQENIIDWKKIKNVFSFSESAGSNDQLTTASTTTP
jgi:hypothetical protein